MSRKATIGYLNSKPMSVCDRILDGMIELARCAKSDRVMVAGSTAPELMLGLHCRGYARVATIATCGLPHGQYGVALVNWEGRSIKTLDTMLDWLVQFLGSSAVLVVRLDPLEGTRFQKVESILNRIGFKVEIGTFCEHGPAVSARRRDTPDMAVAA
jgi:hypothetical protein